MLRLRHFVPPPEAVFRDPEREFLGGAHTYGEYNYLGGGLAARIKTAHFEKALALTRDAFGETDVLDFGCADGFFLPSLSRHFRSVVAVDRVAHFVEVAERVVAHERLANVRVLCNEGLAFDDLRRQIGETRFGVAYLLEVVEHVGEPGSDDVYGQKVALLRQVASLLAPGGRIVISVPTMVGLPFLAQRGALALLGMHREPLGWRSLLRSSLLRDASDLEPGWDGGHLGFSHLRLEQAMAGAFETLEHANLGFQQVYVVRARAAAG